MQSLFLESDKVMRFSRRKLYLSAICLCSVSLLLFTSPDLDADEVHFHSPTLWNVIRGYRERKFISAFKLRHDPSVIRKKIVAMGKKLSEGQVWPHSGEDDRIIAQLNVNPYPLAKGDGNGKLKNILLWSGLGGQGVVEGQSHFFLQSCHVNTCYIHGQRYMADEADMIMFHSVGHPWKPRRPNQIWMMASLECPLRTEDWSEMKGVNWTATYRHDSTIVTPYEKFAPYSSLDDIQVTERNYAIGKSKQVVWFVSNCGSDNGRLEYARELAKYISVDIYGECGEFDCPRGLNDEEECYSKLNTDYKFYLAFENANCKDYITEKFFVLGLQHDVLPIVMGAAPQDYERVAPLHSYIHVEEFSSPRELADFLHLLDRRDDLYNTYFSWKGTGTFINTHFWCRVCALLHDETRPVSEYKKLGDWWSGEGVCIGSDRWDSHRRKHEDTHGGLFA